MLNVFDPLWPVAFRVCRRIYRAKFRRIKLNKLVIDVHEIQQSRTTLETAVYNNTKSVNEQLAKIRGEILTVKGSLKRTSKPLMIICIA